jgi:hypothetical protein
VSCSAAGVPWVAARYPSRRPSRRADTNHKDAMAFWEGRVPPGKAFDEGVHVMVCSARVPH